jgi:hypothetical protein
LREKTKQKIKLKNPTPTTAINTPDHSHEQQDNRHNHFPNCCIPSEIVASMITDLTTYLKTNPEPKKPSLIMKFLLCSMKPEV